MRIRFLTARALWITAFIILGYVMSSRAIRRHTVGVPQALFPQTGDTVRLDSVRAAFGVDLPRKGALLLVVSTSCPGCLALDSELTAIRAAAECAQVQVIPLIVTAGGAPDSMRRVLAKHGMPAHSTGTANSLGVLKIKAVPSLMDVDSHGVVRSVSSPAKTGSWPPKPRC
jgi:hypothetical protein